MYRRRAGRPITSVDLDMAWMAVVLASLLAASVSSQDDPAEPTRLCIPDAVYDSCIQMADEVNNLQCVTGRDRVDCMRKVENQEADTLNLDAQELYVAGRLFNLSIVMFEVHDGDPFRYESVALVAANSTIASLADLRGKRSCHTGLGRNAGWQIPLAVLREQGVMSEDCRGELYTVSAFFNGSCASGAWSPDPLVDAELKTRHPRLCALCEHPVPCSADDETYNGYNGAIRCLLDDQGDVAFTSMKAVKKFTETEPDATRRMQLLCVDGTRKSVADTEPCVWGRRPTNAFVVRQDAGEESRTRISEFLQNVIARYPSSGKDRPEWFHTAFVSKKDVSDLARPRDDQESWNGYLGQFRFTIDKSLGDCDQKEVKFCVTSDVGFQKCQDFAESVYSRRLSPRLGCVQTDSKVACMVALKEGNADLFTLDGGDVYKSGRYYDLQPVSAELYGDLDASYFAVAVARNSSSISSLADLRGVRSCHTGFGRTAGWVVPIGTLVKSNACNPAEAAADYFNSSCVPGANDPKINPNTTRSDDLCRQCIGDEDGQNVCRAPGERYGGYSGAFRCLAEGAGDVAFVKHTTVPQYTNGGSDAPWARDLQESDFKLICRIGGTSVPDYLSCNLAKVPSHYVMTSGNTTSESRLEAAYVLAGATKWFGPDSLRFKAFGRYNGTADLLFKDSATGLKAAPLSATYREVLGEDYYAAVQATDPLLCDK